MVLLDPGKFSETRTYDLLAAASRGHIGLDHRLLHALLDNPSTSLPDLLRFAAEGRKNDRVDLTEDLIALFRHLRVAEALPFFVELVRRDPYDVSDDVVEAFAQFPGESVELLLALHAALGPEAAGEVAFLLTSMRVRDPRVFELLMTWLESDPGEAAFCLGLYGDAAARPALEQALQRLSGTDAREARWARQCIDEALKDLGAPHSPVDHSPFDIWELYPEKAEPQFSIFTDEERLEFLRSAVAEYRAAAAQSFFNQELTSEVRQRLFEVARQDPDAAVRGRCWESLAGAIDRVEIRDAMLTRLSDETAPAWERCGALVGLAEEAGHPEIRRWILEFYGAAETRAKALEAMYRSLDRRFASFFPKHLDDPDPEVRRSSIRGVGHLGIHSEAARLRALFEQSEFRDDALFAYALAVPAEVSRGRARSLFRKIELDAGGLSPAEAELVEWAIDERLALNGYDPVFQAEREHEPEEWEEQTAPEPLSTPKAERNDPCPCGSGKKFKKCCGR